MSAAETIARAVELARAWASDDSHGYDQANRWGPDYDCSSFLISVWQEAGVPVKASGATYTGNMRRVFLACGFADVTTQVNLATAYGMQPGDVLLNERSHTAMYVGGGQLVHASGNEFGGVTGGRSGDQTGGEICVRPYYNFVWDCVLRYAPAETAPESATAPQEGVSAPDGSYVVQPGDSLWSIAQALLGDGSRWEEIWALNGLPSIVIHPGQQLLMPSVSNLNHSEPEPTPTASLPFVIETAPVSLPILQQGISGRDVEALQALLILRGYDLPEWGVDGDFGEETAAALTTFQRAMGLDVTATATALTWSTLIE